MVYGKRKKGMVIGMENRIPVATAATVLNSLKGGVVPRVGLEYITVGRRNEISALLQDVAMIEAGGASFRFIVGKYGSGKTFLMQALRNHVLEKDFVVTDAELSVEKRYERLKQCYRKQCDYKRKQQGYNVFKANEADTDCDDAYKQICQKLLTVLQLSSPQK